MQRPLGERGKEEGEWVDVTDVVCQWISDLSSDFTGCAVGGEARPSRVVDRRGPGYYWDRSGNQLFDRSMDECFGSLK